MAISRMDRNEERGGSRGGERDFDERYRERYSGDDRDRMGWRDPDDGDRERRLGRFGRWDEDRGRDDDRPRYQGWGGQSGSHAGGMGNDRMSDIGGGHRGKGPSGYTRSDERIREDVCDILTEDDHVDASHIEITVKNGEVTLSGTVTDRRSKRMAEDVIEHVPGIRDVINHIRVQDRARESMAGNGGRSQSQSVSSSPERDADSSKRPRA